MEMIEVVNNNGCHHNVTPEQLPAFLEAGWTIIQPAPEKAEKTTKKKSK